MVKEIIEMPKRIFNPVVSPPDINRGRDRFIDQRRRIGTVGGNAQQRHPDSATTYRRRFLSFLKDERGVTIVEFLIVSLILTFFVFGALDYWAILSKHQYAEHLMHRYLQREQVEGRLSTADENNLITTFGSFGCPVESVTAQRESQGQPRILRNPNDLDASTVSLRIVCKPTPQPLLSGKLIHGNVPGSGFRMIVGGSMLSERVTP